MAAESFAFPFFYNYPPYFTLQPVRETRNKQSALWGDFILNYCKYHKVFTLVVAEDSPIFVNSAINRRLSNEARTAFLDELVAAGSAQWLDKGKTKCLILWRKVSEWAELVLSWSRQWGLSGTVVAFEDLRVGDDVRGTDLHGIDRGLLLAALQLLEARGAVRLFRGDAAGEEGVKFL